MTGAKSMKLAWAAAAALLCIGGAAQAAETPAAKPPVAAPAAKPPAKTAAKPKIVTPTPQPGPTQASAAPVVLESLWNAVQAYAAFQGEIDLVTGGSLQNAKDIARALDKAAALNRDQLTRGFIAYGALTAARNEQFVADV